MIQEKKKKIQEFGIGIFITFFITIPVIIISGISDTCKYRDGSCVLEILTSPHFWTYFGIIALLVFFVHLVTKLLHPVSKKLKISNKKLVYIIFLFLGGLLGIAVYLGIL